MIPLFATNLKLDDKIIIIEIIQALDILIKLDKSVPEYQGQNSIALKFEIAGGLNELEVLQKHPNATVYTAVDSFITKNFEVEDPQNEAGL